MKALSYNHHEQIRNPCEGQVLTLGDVSVTLKITGEQTNGAFAIFESTVPPHFAGPPVYQHPHATETFYIVSGVLAFTLAAETMMMRQGGLVTIPPGLLHKFWNPTATPATYLAYLSQPALNNTLSNWRRSWRRQRDGHPQICVWWPRWVLSMSYTRRQPKVEKLSNNTLTAGRTGRRIRPVRPAVRVLSWVAHCHNGLLTGRG